MYQCIFQHATFVFTCIHAVEILRVSIRDDTTEHDVRNLKMVLLFRQNGTISRNVLFFFSFFYFLCLKISGLSATSQEKKKKKKNKIHFNLGIIFLNGAVHILTDGK